MHVTLEYLGHMGIIPFESDLASVEGPVDVPVGAGPLTPIEIIDLLSYKNSLRALLRASAPPLIDEERKG